MSITKSSPSSGVGGGLIKWGGVSVIGNHWGGRGRRTGWEFVMMRILAGGLFSRLWLYYVQVITDDQAMYTPRTG